MPPPLKLTAEQWMDISTALSHGLVNAPWEGLPEVRWTELNRAQRQAILAGLAKAALDEVARWRSAGANGGLSPAEIHQHFDLARIERAEAEEPLKRAEWLSRTGPKQKIGSWKTAVDDILSQAVHFSSEQIRAVDRRLAAKQLPSLRELSGKLNRARAGILKRGKIRTDAEYYVVKEIVCDVDSDVTEAERNKFETLLDTYEQRTK